MGKVPNLHLTKVAVGCASIEALKNRIARRVAKGEVRVPTRMRPKRMEELVGGSLHWIVKHRIVARQEILRFEDRGDGRINIVCSAELVMVPAHAQAGSPGLALSRRYPTRPAARMMAAASANCRRAMYARLAALALV